MARYDPYDRGDNPLRLDLDVLDMPRSSPAARVRPLGASKTKSAAAPAKKKAKPTDAAPARRPPTPDLPVLDIPPVSDRNLPVLPPRVTGPESTAKLAGPTPPISSGLLAGSAPAEPTPEVGPGVWNYLQSQLFNQGRPVPSPGAMAPERLQPLTSGTVAAGTPPGGPVAATAPPTGSPTPIMNPALWDYLRSQLFNQGKPVS